MGDALLGVGTNRQVCPTFRKLLLAITLKLLRSQVPSIFGMDMSWLGRVAGDFARQIARNLVRIYYPKIEVSDRERIPAKDAVLLVANHANSLMDPVIIGIAAKRPVHFLAKAPLFDIPVFGEVLRAVGMLPAYRRSDDASQLKRNLDSISAAAGYLLKGEAVGIFPEGKSHDLVKVEQVRTGAARMAIQAVNGGATDLRIVPVGINYERKERFRSAVWVRIGQPIDVNDWMKKHAEERQAVRSLTLEIDRRLKEVVVNLDEEKWEPFLNDLEVLQPPPKVSARNPIAILHQRKRIADAMNHFLATDRPRAETMAGAIERHRKELAAAGLTIPSDIFRRQGLRLAARMSWEALWMSCGFVLVLAGTLHHLLPFWLTRLLARLVQAPGRSTIALSRLLLGLPIYGAWYAFTWWWISNYFLPWVAWVWLGPMPLAGVLALHYWSRVGSAGKSWWAQLRMLLFRQSELRRLRAGQHELRKSLRVLAEEYAKVHPPAPLPVDAFSWRRFAAFSLRGIVIGLIVLYAGMWGSGWIRDNTISELQHPGPELGRMPSQALGASLDSDEKALGDMMEGLRELEAKAARLQAEFSSGKRSFYNQADDDAVRQLLFSYLTYRTSLLGLIWKYQKHADVRDERLRWRAFLAGFAAASTLYDASLKFVSRFQHSPETVRKLNESEPNWNIPAGVYEMVKRNLLQVKTRGYMSQAWTDYRGAQPEFEKHGLAQTAPYDSFHAAIQRHAESRAELTTLLVEASLSNPVKDMQQAGKSVSYRAQSFVSTWMGNTRIRQPRGGRALIQSEQLEKMRAQLKPGDILIERQNWYLSRAFMPGFWAHAALYVGTTNDLIRFGLDQDARVRRHWKQFAIRDDSGHEHVVLEAVPQGVRMTSFEHCIGVADSAAVLRPRLSEREVREAIARAFSHLGKQYDFEFDFFSTDKLVCTELVCRAYDANIRFPLVDVLGRKTMPPTELVRKYVRERGTPEAQLDCICFLDGDESKGKASFKDEETFVSTLQRPGLTWLQPRGSD